MTDIPSQYAGGGALTTSYYANDIVRSETQDGVTRGWLSEDARRGVGRGARVYQDVRP
jgi:hypothetical protein